MKTQQSAPRLRLLLLGLAVVMGTGLLGGCEAIGGGQSGAKNGPFTASPKAQPGRGKFKSNIKCKSVKAPSNVQTAFAPPEAAGALSAYAGSPDQTRPLPIWPDIPAGQIAVPEFGAQTASTGGGADRSFDCYGY